MKVDIRVAALAIWWRRSVLPRRVLRRSRAGSRRGVPRRRRRPSDRSRAWFTPGTGDRSFLDLERANRDQLEAAGLYPESIFTSGLCTKTHRDRLHSYRGDRDAAGRIVAAIRVP